MNSAQEWADAAAAAYRADAETRVAAAVADLDRNVVTVRDWITNAGSIVVLTGAGISTDSGIPDYRGEEGKWTTDPGAEWTHTIEAWREDPDIRVASWANHAWAETAYGLDRHKPNTGHHAVVALERRARVTLLVTQNIDGLHQAAGSDTSRLIEIHGNTREVVCLDCGQRTPTPAVLDRVRAGDPEPRCHCGGLLKLAVVSFNQNLDYADLEWARDCAHRCDLFLAVGTTLMVGPAAALLPLAKQSGARVVIVNGSDTLMDSQADVLLRGSISDILPRLVPSAS